MLGLSLSHCLLLFAVVLLFFGPKRLPAAGQALGETLRGFKRALEGPEETGDKTPPTRDSAP